MIDRLLSSAIFATRCSVHRTFGVSPGALVFNRDMLLPIPIITDLQNIRTRRQRQIDLDHLRNNRRRRYTDYLVGQQMMILNKNPDALEARATGPFAITQIHTNGTVSFMRRNNVIERINIRRIKPYFGNLNQL